MSEKISIVMSAIMTINRVDKRVEQNEDVVMCKGYSQNLELNKSSWSWYFSMYNTTYVFK